MRKPSFHRAIDHERTIGILGGMGPQATLALFETILERTRAETDQDHFRIVIDNNPKIPDRTKALLGEGPDPLPLLMDTARNLERAGADVILMPCNTAHAYYEDLAEAVHVPFVNMIEATADRVRERRIGLLATTGTVKASIYELPLRANDIKVIYPASQAEIMDVIYRVKTGQTGVSVSARLDSVIDELLERGAEGLIAGCTEISLILHPQNVPVPCYDPLVILAERAIHLAQARDSSSTTGEASHGH